MEDEVPAARDGDESDDVIDDMDWGQTESQGIDESRSGDTQITKPCAKIRPRSSPAYAACINGPWWGCQSYRECLRFG